MKWLTANLDRRIEALEKQVDFLFNDKSQCLKDAKSDYMSHISALYDCIKSLEAKIEERDREIEAYRRLDVHESKERDRLLREDLDLGLTGLASHVDKRLNHLGEKKGIVVDLLKKLAKLEKDEHVTR